MLDGGISEKGLCAVEKMVKIAHDLIECDVMLHKMESMESGKPSAPLFDNPGQRKS